MEKRILVCADGTWAFWCLGCKKYHHLNHRWKFNGNLILATFHPNVRSSQDDPLIICESEIQNGKIRYLPSTTHRYRNMEFELPTG